METEPPQAPENSDQAQAVAVSTTTDDQQQSPSQARSYECTFCKRGFSNAQALGGHMNIHRKDKAKLKQASNESTQTQQLLDIPQSPPPLYPPPIPPNPIQIPEYKSSDQEKSSKKWPWIFSTDQGSIDHETHLGGGQLRQLPLFAEIASRSENRDHAGKDLSSSHEQLAPEVDLELRLGHEPQDSSSAAATGTKKFF